jgi:two-component system response regulator GlrR
MRLVCISSGQSNQPAWLEALHGLDVEDFLPWEGLDHLKTSSCDAVVVSLPLEGCSTEDLLEQIQRFDACLPVIIHDPQGTLADAVRLIKLGAFHFLTGNDAEEFRQVLEWAAESSRSRNLAAQAPGISAEPWRKSLVGESSVMQQLLQIIRLIGPRRSTVLLSGETGAGKEMVARAIHQAGDRTHATLVAVNCTALPENLLKAELFGHVKGAFTGAVNHRVGRFEQATAAPYFSTKSEISLWIFRRSCCGSCKSGNFSASAVRKPSRWMCG